MDIFITSLPFQVREIEVQQLFAKFGKVESVILIKDKITRQSKGFGFVKMPNNKEAQEAIAAINESELRGRTIYASVAEQRERKANRNDITFASEKKRPSFNAQVRSQNGGKFMDRKKKNNK